MDKEVGRRSPIAAGGRGRSRSVGLRRGPVNRAAGP